MNKQKPLVSIVMPVYNAGDFLVDAIESILAQTYQNFEFIIVDDASTDNSLNILERYAKQNKKIQLFRNPTNQGVSASVKKAITHANGDFIARMDADDIALSHRLEKQVSYLLAHKETVAIGSQCLLINRDGKVIGEKKFPTSARQVYKYIYRFVPLQQPTLMIAKTRLPEDFIYYLDGMNTAEEVELFFKLFRFGKVENLPDYLLLYRMHDKNTSLVDIKRTFFLTLIARIKAAFLHGYKPELTGILITLLQAIIVLLLPKKATLILYRIARKISTYRLAFPLSAKQLSINHSFPL